LSIKRKLTKRSAALEINLRELLGKSPPRDSDFRDAVAQKAIDMIVDRTQKKQRSWRGHNFKKYSEDYKNSNTFDAFGKGKERVDLTLSGDMLGLLNKTDETRDKIELGWDDDKEKAKAANHVQGVTVPKRDFFNLNKKELKELKRFAERLIDDGEGDDNS
jgi:hypothetical protein